MERFSDMGFQKKIIIFCFNNTKDYPLIEDVPSFIFRCCAKREDQVVMNVNCSVLIWRDSILRLPELESSSCFLDMENNKIYCSSYDFDLSAQLAKLGHVSLPKTRMDLVFKLAQFLIIALPFAKFGDAWFDKQGSNVIPHGVDTFSYHLKQYEALCLRKGMFSIDVYLKTSLIEYSLRAEKKLVVEQPGVWKFTNYYIKRSSIDFLKGREIRHIVYSVGGAFRAESVVIRGDSSHKKLRHFMPKTMDFSRFDSLIYDVSNPETHVLAEPVRWALMESCGFKPYNHDKLCGKTNIPVVVEECFMVVMVKHGYVRSNCGVDCTCCFVYDNLIPCESGQEHVDGLKIYMSPSFLGQYLQSFNRLHHKEHLFFVLSDLL